MFCNTSQEWRRAFLLFHYSHFFNPVPSSDKTAHVERHLHCGLHALQDPPVFWLWWNTPALTQGCRVPFPQCWKQFRCIMSHVGLCCLLLQYVFTLRHAIVSAHVGSCFNWLKKTKQIKQNFLQLFFCYKLFSFCHIARLKWHIPATGDSGSLRSFVYVVSVVCAPSRDLRLVPSRSEDGGKNGISRQLFVVPQKSSGQKWNTASLSVSPTPKSLRVAQAQRSWPSSFLIVSLNTGRVSTGEGRAAVQAVHLQTFFLRSTTFSFRKEEEKAFQRRTRCRHCRVLRCCDTRGRLYTHTHVTFRCLAGTLHPWQGNIEPHFVDVDPPHPNKPCKVAVSVICKQHNTLI